MVYRYPPSATLDASSIGSMWDRQESGLDPRDGGRKPRL